MLLSVLLVYTAGAQPPVGYWAEVDTTDAGTLRETIHETIRGHTRVPFGSGANWPVLEEADAHPEDPDYILDIYKNDNMPVSPTGSRPYDREHVWPRSLGFPNETGLGRYPFSDMHALYLCDRQYNNFRSNHPFRNVPGLPRDEFPTDENAGMGGGSGVYPENSNWRGSIGGRTYWQVWSGRQGDAARAILYMDVRYEGGEHPDGTPEPDLIAVNNASLIQSSGGENAAVAYMGILDDMMQWHRDDPPNDIERGRHEVIFEVQNNRNPFIDYPEWAECLYAGDCSEVAPMEPKNLVASLDEGEIVLSWDSRPETNLTGYFLYRSSVSGGPYERVNDTPVTDTVYTDLSIFPEDEVPLYYVVTAENDRGLESTFSIEAVADFDFDAPGMDLIISEYVEGSSFNKALEFHNASPASIELTGRYEVWIYFNGADEAQSQIALSGEVAPGEVHVLAHPSASSVILDVADETDSRLLHNGDDAIELRRFDGNGGSVVVDSLGEVGYLPDGGAWTGNGVSTRDQTLVRKPGIFEGRADSGSPFDPSEEWIGHPRDTFDFLGFHEILPEEAPAEGILIY